eukprot:556736-Amphidinium_carterae.1
MEAALHWCVMKKKKVKAWFLGVEDFRDWQEKMAKKLRVVLRQLALAIRRPGRCPRWLRSTLELE